VRTRERRWHQSYERGATRKERLREAKRDLFVMTELTDELLDDAEQRMEKSVENCRHELATVRTGRASPHLLDRLMIDYYGAETPLKQLANVAAPDARLLTLTPYDKNSIGLIEKAIMESDLGLTPSNDGNVIRLQIPELNEERRQEMVKVVHGVAEEGKVAVRNIRRDVMHDLRELKKEGEAGADDEHRAESELQKLTDGATEEIDKALKAKEEEILEV
jgi:ribosome recycling factor